MKKFSFLIAGFFFLIIFNGGVLAKQPVDSDPLVVLGKLVYEDPAFSANGNQSCQSCHHPDAKFSDPVNRISPMYRPVSEGSIPAEFGTRNAPPAAYASFSPVFHYDTVEGLFFGGLFWDGRATGRLDITDTQGLGAGATEDALADQAKGPFGNPVEMALPTGDFARVEEQVVSIVADKYLKEYLDAFGNTINNVDDAYNNIALAISAFEKSGELNRFKSKFDRFRDEQGGDVSTFISVPAGFTSDVYTREEAEGLALFNDKAQCNLCHPTANLDAKTPSVFTDFSYDNLGIPKNSTIDSLKGAAQPIDYGLGAQVAILIKAADAVGVTMTTIEKPDGQMVVDGEEGKFKVSSLRNIAKTAPYGHNGFFPTLYDIVHFYNTRDVSEWPAAEVPETVNTDELGALNLTFEEEQKIVLFLETLTDDK